MKGILDNSKIAITKNDDDVWLVSNENGPMPGEFDSEKCANFASTKRWDLLEDLSGRINWLEGRPITLKDFGVDEEN